MMIRSQDKMNLVPIGKLYIQSGTEYADAKIILDSGDDRTPDWALGTYKNVERCIKILDEIQKAYLSYLSCEGGISPLRGGGTYQPFAFVPPQVYEMPEE